MDAMIQYLMTAEMSVPVSQIMMLLGLSTLALLFGKVKLALLINYLFTLYWGYFLNREKILESFQGIEYFTFIYFGVGLLLAIIALLAFLTTGD